MKNHVTLLILLFILSSCQSKIPEEDYLNTNWIIIAEEYQYDGSSLIMPLKFTSKSEYNMGTLYSGSAIEKNNVLWQCNLQLKQPFEDSVADNVTCKKGLVSLNAWGKLSNGIFSGIYTITPNGNTPKSFLMQQK